jgi:hypothetical protein
VADPRELEKQLFISYAHIDNQPITADQQGWVSRFHASLEAMLSMRLGRKALIWRDKKLAGNDIFADEIVAQFPKTALLISVLTPRYVESEWCTREVREFCDVARQSGGVVVSNKSRIIKVIKTPVDSEGALPAVMKEVLGYEFYVFDDEKAPLELDPIYGPDMAQKYNIKVVKLAWDIAQQLKKLEAAGVAERPEAEPVSSKPVIYLAECSWDQRQAREALEMDLRLHGYPIVPDRGLPREEAAYVAEVKGLLEQSKLSIHLVGKSYGAVPDGPTQKSVVALQNELAIARSARAGLPRVVWLPEGTQSEQPEQQRFIEMLQTNAEAQFGADVLIGDLEALKGAVHAALEKLATREVPAAARGSAAGAAGLVYLICDERDREATRPLRRFLRGRGFDVQLPVFEGDAGTVRRSNQDMLTQCEAVIVFYGAGDESWKRTVDSDLRKMKGYRGEKPLVAACTYVAEPATGDKTDLIAMEDPNVTNGLGGLSEAAMEPFIKAFQGAARR